MESMIKINEINFIPLLLFVTVFFLAMMIYWEQRPHSIAIAETQFPTNADENGTSE